MRRGIIDKLILYEILQFRSWLQNCQHSIQHLLLIYYNCFLSHLDGRCHSSEWQYFPRNLSKVFANHLFLKSTTNFISSIAIHGLICGDVWGDRDQPSLIPSGGYVSSTSRKNFQGLKHPFSGELVEVLCDPFKQCICCWKVMGD